MKENNLWLNANKCKEITFQSSRAKARKSHQLPPLCWNIKRQARAADNCSWVILNDRLTASDHITYLITSCTWLLYALHVLRGMGYHNNLCTMSTKQRFKGSFCMLPPHGLDSALQGIEWGSTYSSTDAGNLDILTETWRLETCVLMQINSFLTGLFIIQIMYSTDCYQHPQQRLNDTILEAAGTHSSNQTMALAC